MATNPIPEGSVHVTFFVVEDSEATRRINEKICRQVVKGSTCYTAANEADAEQILAEKIFPEETSRGRLPSDPSIQEAVVFLFDNEFPVAPGSPPSPNQGLHLLRSCRKRHSSPDLRTYCISSSDDADQEKFGEFDAVLGKPLKKQQLKTQLSAWRLLPTDTQPPETQPPMSHIEDLVPKQMEEPIQK